MFRLTVPLLVAAALIVAAALTDRATGRYLMPDRADLVFPAYSRAHHQSNEFDLTVRINNLGFRGPDVSIAKKRKRILLLGDSFTFGWGVEEHETWAQLLQMEFPDWEILNLGRGGTHPGDHVQLARKAIPLLRPDLVIVGVLQANDLHQLMRIIAYERGQRQPMFPEAGGDAEGPTALHRFTTRLFPNLMHFRGARVEIRDRWLREAELLLTTFSAEDSARYVGLEQQNRDAFEKGLLNPSLVFEAVYFPDAHRAAADTARPLLRDAMVRLHDYLVEMRQLCAAHGTALLAVGLPNRPYGCPDCVPDLVGLGYAAQGCDTLNADLPFISAAQRAGVNYFTVPAQQIPGRADYYPMDGHWNPSGHRKFARSLASHLSTVLL
ncbi:MAG: hypothetical protein K9J06_00470 [Flavobacteriales bacterium]|nr:hypothetical protein [Flavobacteriales bacterium]